MRTPNGARYFYIGRVTARKISLQTYLRQFIQAPINIHSLALDAIFNLNCNAANQWVAEWPTVMANKNIKKRRRLEFEDVFILDEFVTVAETFVAPKFVAGQK